MKNVTRAHIHKISFGSPLKNPIILDFTPGLNIIHGASNTGKSFIAKTLDFMLGGSSSLKDIPERAGYDRVDLDIHASTGENIHLERSIDGGDFSLKDNDDKKIILAAKHNPKREDNLSRYLLSLFDLKEKEILFKKSGDKRNLSFRDLISYLVIHEEAIIKDSSPMLTQQHISVTPEKAVFKLLLTGTDDSALVSAKKVKSDTYSIELIEQLISDYKTDLKLETDSESGIKSVKSVEDQLEKLMSSIEKQNKAVDSVQESLQESLLARNDLSERREKLLNRINEIKGLLERFDLLEKHYTNDLSRLEAIKESGSLLTFMNYQDCPLCGAVPDNQNHDQSCDGDIKSVIDASNAEILKILQLKKDLSKTADDLKNEERSLHKTIEEYDKELENIQNNILRKLAPDLAINQNKFSELVKKQYQVSRSKDILGKIASLEEKKRLLKNRSKSSTETSTAISELSKSVVGELSRKIEAILMAWGVPDAGTVYFDSEKFDFVISDKPRGSNGKGLLAITHAAFSIGLLEYCITNNLPHPGFVLLDSPLLAYKPPEPNQEPDPDNAKIAQTDLKDKFYLYLSNLDPVIQVIIAENVAPPENLTNANIIHFVGKNAEGRFGLFPKVEVKLA
jgi:hypothetical protein